MTRVKICGITNPEDALMAASIGADALGFVFVTGPRYVSPSCVRQITLKLPPFIHRVGVFVNEDPSLVMEIARICGLTILQFHGTESPEYIALFPLPCIKAFRITVDEQMPNLFLFRVSGYLFDAHDTFRWGGTGKVADWDLITKLPSPGPVILAGGLNPSNIREALLRVRPYGVDVSSGVESAPGKKDIQKLKEFILQVKGFNRESIGKRGQGYPTS